MKKIFTLLLAALAAVTVNAQTDVTCDPTLPVTFDDSWSANFLATPGTVSAGDKIIFTAEPYEVSGSTWQWGAQILPKVNTTGWPNLCDAISVSAAGDYTLTLTAAYADSINTYGGLRVQGICVKVTAVQIEKATPVDPDAEQRYLFDITNMDQLWSGTTNDNGTVTYPAAWAGAGWWVGNSTTLASYNSIVFILSEPATIDLLPQVFATDADGNATNVNVTLYAGDTIAVLDISGINTNTVSTVMLQNFAEGTAKLKTVYASSLTADDALVAAGIKKVTTENTTLNENAPIYNLAGQRVSKSYKGVVIQNGRKRLNK